MSWSKMKEVLKEIKSWHMHIAKWKKPIWGGYIVYDPNSMRFWKNEKL